MAMLLAGENGTEFELGLIEETLDEDLQDGEGDDKTLTLSFRVATPEESWEETSPCLNTFEVNNLVDWLEGIVGVRPDMPELELLEPELRFSVVGDRGDQVTLRIDFHIKDRPEKHQVDSDTDADHVNIKIARPQVRAAVEELKRDLEELQLSPRSNVVESELGEVAAPAEELIEDIEAEETGEGEDNTGWPGRRDTST
jgi:hypothetical protein